MRRLAAGFLVLISSAVGAQSTADYPARPIRFIVGSDPGSAPDVLARIVAHGVSNIAKQQVVVENRPGAAATMGADLVARAQPDGYTYMFSAAVHTITPSVRRNLPYHPVNSFTPIARVVSSPFVLVISPQLPVKSVEDLVAHAKQRPGQLNYSTPGAGSAQHLSAELLALKTQTRFVHVPYKSGSAALNAVLGGDVQFCFVGLPVAMPHLGTGRVRALAVTTSARFPATPDIPTAAEAGLAGFEADNWHAVFGPAGIAPAIVERFHALLSSAVKEKDVNDRILQAGAVVNLSTASGLRELMQSEVEKWSSTAKAAGVSPE
ncbi:MAG: Bug family tripartite tricarboxylate transporter substrate binding protein [Betaproteobacteria bacterium]